MASRIANITARGARRRAIGGVVWLAISAAALAAMLATHQPRSMRPLLFIPLGFAALGLLQAREKT